MWHFSEQDVHERLKKVIDPELMINIVDLGLIYSVVLEETCVRIQMTLTSPGCPLAPVIHMMVVDALSSLEGVTAQTVIVDLTFDPPWTPDMMSEEAKAELGYD